MTATYVMGGSMSRVQTVMTLEQAGLESIAMNDARSTPVSMAKKSVESFIPRRIVFPKRIADAVTLVQLEIREQPQLLDPIPGSILLDPYLGSLGLPAIEVGDEVKAIVQRHEHLEHVQLSIIGELSREAEIQRLMRSGIDLHKGIIGLNADVGTAGTTVLSAQSQMHYPFKPVRLAVSPECHHFMISDLRIGRDASFWSHIPISASMFPPIPEDAADFIKEALRIELPVVQVGQLVTLSVSNPREPMAFAAALHGFLIDYRE